MVFTWMLLLCDLLYLLLLKLIIQLQMLLWKMFLTLNHHKLSSASGGSGAEEVGLCEIRKFLVLAHVHERRCQDLVGLSEMIMLKILKKEPVWLLSLTQSVLKLTQLSLDVSSWSRCLRSPFPQPIKTLQTESKERVSLGYSSPELHSHLRAAGL